MTCHMTTGFCLIQELDLEEDSGSNISRGPSCETLPTDTPLPPPTPQCMVAV